MKTTGNISLYPRLTAMKMIIESADKYVKKLEAS